MGLGFEFGVGVLNLNPKGLTKHCWIMSHVAMLHLSCVFLMVKPSKIIFLMTKLYPKRRIESYSLMVTIVSPN